MSNHTNPRRIGPVLAVLLASLWLGDTAGAGVTMRGSSITIQEIDDEMIAREGIEKRARRDVDGRGRDVEIDATVSQLTIERSEDDQVSIDARLAFWTSDDRWLAQVEQEDLDLQVNESSGRISISLRPPEQPRGRKRARKISYDLRATLRVPEGTALEVTNKFGNVEVRDIGGPLRAELTTGNLRVRGAQQRADLATSFGRIELQGIEGDVRARVKSGGLEARDIDGELDAEVSFGRTVLEDVRGPVTVRAESGDIQARRLGGRTELRNSFGRIEVSEVTGDLVVHAESGGIRARDVEGSVEAHGSFGPIEVTGATGHVDVDCASGSATVADSGKGARVKASFGQILLKNIGGDVELIGESSTVQLKDVAGGVHLRNSFGKVTVAGARGALDVGNESGSVEIAGLNGAALTATHRIETSFGSIELAWPDDRLPAVEARASFGEIHTDFDGQVKRGMDGQTLVTGSPPRLRLDARSGSVRLKRGR